MTQSWENASRIAIGLLVMVGCASVQRTPDVRSGRVDVGQDGFLAYDVSGKGAAVVLIHGGLINRRMWDAQFSTLARRFRVVRYDARCHGESGGSDGAWDDHEDLRALLDHLGLRRIALVGHSMGGRIAIDFALSYPDRVSALVVAGSGLSGFRFPDTNASPHNASFRAAWIQGDRNAATEAFLCMWTDGPRRAPGDVDHALRSRVREMVRLGVARAMQCPVPREPDPPAIGRIREIRAPMLVILGALDMTDIHSIAERLTAEVPGARRVVIPGTAHMVNMERPREFNRAVLGFLSEHSGR